jgi:tripartite-type tricarboxylate transporter receptor subunit TctC
VKIIKKAPIVIRRGGLAALLLAVTAGVGAASDFPSQPVRLVVPFSAGGPTDTAARLIAEPLRRQLGQPVVIENRPGASGVPGTEAVVQSEPDGYTLVVGGIAPIVLVPAVKQLRYDVSRDLVPLGLIWRSPQVLAVRAALGASTVAEFVDHARKNAGRATIGSAGVGTVTHLAGELFKREAGIELVHVPYRSTSNSLTDLIGGQIDAIFGDVAILSPHVKSGAIRALAVTSPDRSLLLPDLPTMAEAGYPNVQTEVWFGLLASAKTPAPVLERLKTAVRNAQQDPAYVKSLAEFGTTLNEPGAGPFADFIRRENERWTPILKATGVTFD